VSSPFRRFVVTAAALALGLAARGVAVADPAGGQPVDGVHCDAAEGSLFHIHQHVAIFDHGRAVTIPSDVGRPVVGQCLYWIHTHTADGIIHIESPQVRGFSLGQLFDIWGQPLSPTHVASGVVKKGQLRVFVGGRPYAGDPRAIGLTAHADIVLEAGPPYRKPALFTGWGDL